MTERQENRLLKIAIFVLVGIAVAMMGGGIATLWFPKYIDQGLLAAVGGAVVLVVMAPALVLAVGDFKM